MKRAVVTSLAVAAALGVTILPSRLAAQHRTQVNGFGYLESTVSKTDRTDGYFTVGEHVLTVFSSLTDHLTFLGEAVIKPSGSSATGYLPSIERALVRYSYLNNHSIIAGKLHTPVNYWNDVYHHGRLFFPVVDRPYAFTSIVPLHTLGVQAQGQNLGRAKFGYDVVVGNGLSSTDVSDAGVTPAVTVAFHVKPVAGLRIGASYYRDYMSRNGTDPHSGQTLSARHSATLYTGPLNYELESASLAWFGHRIEVLNELSVGQSHTDSLGTAHNLSSFTYLGVRVSERVTPYAFADYIRVADDDLHVYPLDKRKVAAGMRFEITEMVSIKTQIEHQYEYSRYPVNGPTASLPITRAQTLGLRVQLAYGF